MLRPIGLGSGPPWVSAIFGHDPLRQQPIFNLLAKVFIGRAGFLATLVELAADPDQK